VTDEPQSGGDPDVNPVVKWLTRGLDWIAALLLFVMMALTFADVVARDVFDEPFAITTDATRLMLAAMVYAVLPTVSRLEQHVGVDLLDAWLPASWTRPRQAVLNLVAAVIFGVVAWQIWIVAGQKLSYDERTTFVEWPVYPLFYFIAVMSGLTALALLYIAVHYIVGRPPNGSGAKPPSAS
jgi:TRAP-type C4-dicarboxylate transport system permease small subunit